MPSPKPPKAGPTQDSARAAISRTSASSVNSAANDIGASPTAAPTAPAMTSAISAPTHAVRRAVCQSPAPTARPTSAVSAEPTPNASGIIRNSSRAEMPYAATTEVP
ncbi:hypothetical protein D3C87_1274510 [compost metagenome]